MFKHWIAPGSFAAISIGLIVVLPSRINQDPGQFLSGLFLLGVALYITALMIAKRFTRNRH